MKKSVFKMIYFCVVLALALFFCEKFMNKGNTDMTVEMGDATLPLAYMVLGADMVNVMHGYTEDMDVAHMRDAITPVEADRQISVYLEKFDADVKSLSYQVRSSDGTRLIENGEIEHVNEDSKGMLGDFTIKDLIEQGKEYNLILQAELFSGLKVNYFTRIVLQEGYHVREKLDFIKTFHSGTFHRETASENLVPYLEPNAKGDNTTFQKVDIHSSLQQVTWGDLQVSEPEEYVMNIRQMMPQTTSVEISYRLPLKMDGEEKVYLVKEFYRIRYTETRIYLLEFERNMEELFRQNAGAYGANKIALGIQDVDKLQIQECEGGSVFAFGVSGSLYSYNSAETRVATLLSFYDDDHDDARTVYDAHRTKLLDVDEAGNVRFAVFGYMNRGRREGKCGIQISQYNSSQNTVEELIFIDYDKSPELLMREMEELCYGGTRNRLYLKIDSGVYEVNLEKCEYKPIAENLGADDYRISASGQMLAYLKPQEKGESVIGLLNMATGAESEISPEYGNRIRPLGFLGEDLIYGLTRVGDLSKDTSGHIFSPMHTIRIQSNRNEQKKEYHIDEVYTIGCELEENRIRLHRVKQNSESGAYEPIDDDQIMYAEEEEQGKNTLVSVVVDVQETIWQLAAKNEFDVSALQFQTPKEILFEGEKNMEITAAHAQDYYYVYTTKGLQGAYVSAAEAVNLAYEQSGIVVNDTGDYVWYKGNRVSRNQIMKITGLAATEQDGQLAACLNAIMSFEGVNRSSQYMLDRGMTSQEILEANIPGIQVLDLGGCGLDAILYYVNQDIPVLITLDGGRAMLVIGFNELNIVVMDPADGSVYKMGMNDSTQTFEQAGNGFITYMRVEQ